MSEKNPKQGLPPDGRPKGPGLFSLLKPYRGLVYPLVGLTIVSASVGLMVPLIIRQGINAFVAQRTDIGQFLLEFFAASIGSFLLTFAISFVQTYTAEKVARDLRTQLTNRISRQDYAFLQKTSSAQLLTNLTADVDSIKIFISQAVATIFSTICV